MASGTSPVERKRKAATIVRGDAAQRISGQHSCDCQRLRPIPPAHCALQQLCHTLHTPCHHPVQFTLSA